MPNPQAHVIVLGRQVTLAVCPAPPPQEDFFLSVTSHPLLAGYSTSIASVRLEVIEAGGKRKLMFILSRKAGRKKKKTNTLLTQEK